MEIEQLNDSLSKPLINGSINKDDEIKREKYKLALVKLNLKIQEIENILQKFNSEKSSTKSKPSTPTPVKKHNTRKRKNSTITTDYDPSDDFVFPNQKRKVVSSSPIGTTSSRRSSRRSSTNVVTEDNLRSSRRNSRASARRRPVHPLHPNVVEALDYCHSIIQDLRKHKYAFPFLKPVDPVALKIPDYFDIIKEPMDLGTVKERLENNYYASVYEFIEDTRLIWRNAMTYNHPDSDVFKMAQTLSDKFEADVVKAIEMAEKTTEETKREYNEKIERYQQEIKEYERKIQEIKEKMPADAFPIIEVKKIKSTPRTNRPMTYDEKLRLSQAVNELDPKYYSGIISIIEQEVPSALKDQKDEIEFNIDEFEPYVLWRIDDFINNYVRANQPSQNDGQNTTVSSGNGNETEEAAEKPNDYDDSSSSDSDSESSDSDSDSDESSVEHRNELVSNPPEASVSSSTVVANQLVEPTPSIVPDETDVKNVEILNADSWSKLNVAEDNANSENKADDTQNAGEYSDPVWQEFINRGKQNLMRV